MENIRSSAISKSTKAIVVSAYSLNLQVNLIWSSERIELKKKIFNNKNSFIGGKKFSFFDRVDTLIFLFS